MEGLERTQVEQMVREREKEATETALRAANTVKAWWFVAGAAAATTLCIMLIGMTAITVEVIIRMK